jgi:perosamine synthetase
MNTKFKIPVYKPTLPSNVKEYVNQCIDSTWISSRGEFIRRFEEEFSDLLDIPYSASVSSGTTALHTALAVLSISEGDEIIVPDLTYIASINAIAYIGAKPILVDSDSMTWNIDEKLIEDKITRKTKAIMAVHLYGNPCNLEALRVICDKNNLYLIEDAAEAFGTKYKESYCGSYGDISAFSFFGNKTITTGEGGMVTSKTLEFHERAQFLKSQAVSPVREYWHDEIGYNYRMTNIQAAIGLAQLENSSEILNKKKELAHKYQNHLKELPVKFQKEQDFGENSYWMVSITVEDKKTRDDLRHHLSNVGIETRPFFHPASRMPVFTSEFKNENAYRLADTGLSLPSFPSLSQEEFDFICDQFKNFFRP